VTSARVITAAQQWRMTHVIAASRDGGHTRTMRCPLPLLQEIVYGPVATNRLGASLGVNLLPANLRVCNMTCAYCHFSSTRWRDGGLKPGGWPAPDEITAAVGSALDALAARGQRVERVTLTGHGEPTLHPEFEAVVDRLRRLRDERFPGVSLAILSNSTTARWPSVRRGLERLDERYMKLDAGSDGMLRRLNGATTPTSRIVEGLRELDDVIVLGIFVQDETGEMDNTTEGAITDWLRALWQIRPSLVYVGTVDALPPGSALQPPSPSCLMHITERVRATGLRVELFASSPATGYPYSYTGGM
jgi:wyosine [tRNA(Phe)-imidazoG37] synthetase (radical SAM superfamily)